MNGMMKRLVVLDGVSMGHDSNAWLLNDGREKNEGKVGQSTRGSGVEDSDDYELGRGCAAEMRDVGTEARRWSLTER